MSITLSLPGGRRPRNLGIASYQEEWDFVKSIAPSDVDDFIERHDAIDRNRGGGYWMTFVLPCGKTVLYGDIREKLRNWRKDG